MKKILPVAFFLSCLLMQAGCAPTPLKDGYQFGDATLSAGEAAMQYCQTVNPFTRYALLHIIRSKNPTYPAAGICQ